LCRRHTDAGGNTAHGEAPIAWCPCELCDLYARCVRRAAPRIRPDMRRFNPPLAARRRPGVGLVRSFMDCTRTVLKDRIHRFRNRSRSGFTNR
jgi:hypothetical protein